MTSWTLSSTWTTLNLKTSTSSSQSLLSTGERISLPTRSGKIWFQSKRGMKSKRLRIKDRPWPIKSVKNSRLNLRRKTSKNSKSSNKRSRKTPKYHSKSIKISWNNSEKENKKWKNTTKPPINSQKTKDPWCPVDTKPTKGEKLTNKTKKKTMDFSDISKLYSLNFIIKIKGLIKEQMKHTFEY